MGEQASDEEEGGKKERNREKREKGRQGKALEEEVSPKQVIKTAQGRDNADDMDVGNMSGRAIRACGSNDSAGLERWMWMWDVDVDG